MKNADQFATLKEQVIKLFVYLQKVKQEIASIKHPRSKVDHFNTVADQLDAIVDATEEATNTIMESTESITDAVADLKGRIDTPEAGESFARIAECASSIFEACSFQDITGQRISKIVNTINLIEGTLNSLVVIIGEKGLAALPLDEEADDRTEDGEESLHGPALEGEGVTQEEIDKMFD